MFAPFIIALRAAGVPASVTEYLALLRALKAGVAGFDVEDFYHLARAALESVAYQTMDLAEAMKADAGEGPAILRVDGGMAANDWLCRFLANMIGTPVERPAGLETTARGAAFHAGLATGVWSGTGELERLWSREHCFEPTMPADARAPLVAGWKDAVARTLGAARG